MNLDPSSGSMGQVPPSQPLHPPDRDAALRAASRPAGERQVVRRTT